MGHIWRSFALQSQTMWSKRHSGIDT